MGSSGSKEKNKEQTNINNSEQKDETEEIEEINLIEKSEKESITEIKNQNDNIKEDVHKKEELKQSILQKIKEEEMIYKIKFTNEEFLNYIIKFYEEFIQIFYSLPKKNLFTSLVIDFNKKYLFTFHNKEFPNIPIKENFFEIFKYSSIIIVCFAFMTKDLELHKKYNAKIKEPIEKFIYSIINMVGRNTLKTKLINIFIKNFKKAKRGPAFCINDVIKILFTTGKYAAAYKNLKNALGQIIDNIETEPTEVVVTRINESVLFFFNAGTYIAQPQSNSTVISMKDTKEQKEIKEPNTVKKTKNGKFETKNTKEDKKVEEDKKDLKDTNNENQNGITEPFITEPMTKEFCLVLDIDETISHTMRLSFGNYFLLRPGVIHLIKKLYHFFEIDIFTAAIKRYADNIVNKLDPKDVYINYRFYREHCIYEGTKTVKKLVRIGRELNKIIFVDNIKYNAKYNMDNLYHVSSWKDNVYDDEMIKLQDLLIDIIVDGKFKDDIRKGIAGKDDLTPEQRQIE